MLDLLWSVSKPYVVIVENELVWITVVFKTFGIKLITKHFFTISFHLKFPQENT